MSRFVKLSQNFGPSASWGSVGVVALVLFYAEKVHHDYWMSDEWQVDYTKHLIAHSKVAPKDEEWMVDRTADVKNLASSLRASRLNFFCGSPGIGKSTLARRLAADWQYGSLLLDLSRISNNGDVERRWTSMVNSVMKPPPWWWKLFDTRTDDSKNRVFERALAELKSTPPMIVVDDASNVIHKVPQTGLFRALCALAEPAATLVLLVGSHASAFQDLAKVDRHAAIRTHFIHPESVRDHNKLLVYVKKRAAAMGRTIGDDEATALVDAFEGYFGGHETALHESGKLTEVVKLMENYERAVVREVLDTTSDAGYKLVERVLAAPQGVPLSNVEVTDSVVNTLLHSAVLTIEHRHLCFPYPLKAVIAKDCLETRKTQKKR